MKVIDLKMIFSQIIKIGMVVLIVVACAINNIMAQNNDSNGANWTKMPKMKIKGKILLPAEGSVVETQFTASGTFQGTARHLWLVVKVGNLYWPKEPEVKPDQGQWTSTVNEGGDPGIKFELILVDVSDAASQMFQKLITDGAARQSWPGLTRTRLGDARFLAAKKLKLE